MQTNGKSPSLEEMRERRAILQEAMELQALEHKFNALESLHASFAGGWGSFVNPYEYLPDMEFGGQYNNYFFSRVDSRAHGRDAPLYRNEMELGQIRHQSRNLCRTNNAAKGLLRNLVNYVVGKGYPCNVVPLPRFQDVDSEKPGAQIPKRVQQITDAVQRWIDDFFARNKFRLKQREIYRRIKRDGECFLRLFCNEETGKTTLRWVEPEQIINPPGGTEANGWSFGIRHQVEPVEDVETVVAYYVAYKEDAANGVVVEAKDMLHIKNFDEDGTVKRGLPEFSFETYESLRRAGVLQRNMSITAASQAAVAEITQFENASKSQVEEFNRSQQALTAQSPYNGRTEQIDVERPGQKRQIPKGQSYVEPPFSQSIPLHLQVEQADLRTAAAAVSAPEYFTGNSDGSNFAAIRETSAPFLKNADSEQDYLSEALKQLLTDVVRRGVEYGSLPQDTFHLVELQIEPAVIVQRDPLQRTQELTTQVQARLTSPQTAMLELGRHPDKEKANWQEWDESNGGDMAGLADLFGGIPGGNGQGEGSQWGGDSMPFTESRKRKRDNSFDRIAAMEGFTGTITDKLGRKRRYVNGKPVANKSDNGDGSINNTDNGFGSGDVDQIRELYQASQKDRIGTLGKVKQLAATADGAKIGEYQSLDPKGQFWTDGRSIYPGEIISHFLTGSMDFSPAQYDSVNKYISEISNMYNEWKLDADALEFPAVNATKDEVKKWWKENKNTEEISRLRRTNPPGGYYFHPSGWVVDTSSDRLIEPAKAEKLKRRIKKEYGTESRRILESGFTGTKTDSLGRKVKYVDGKRVAGDGGDTAATKPRMPMKAKAWKAAKNIIAIANAAPAFAKETMLKAGFSPKVATAAYIVATVGDYAVPGLPAASAVITIMATIRKPAAPLEVVRELIAKFKSKKATESIDRDLMMAAGELLHNAAKYEWAMTVLAVAIEDEGQLTQAAIDTTAAILDEQPEPVDQVTESIHYHDQQAMEAGFTGEKKITTKKGTTYTRYYVDGKPVARDRYQASGGKADGGKSEPQKPKVGKKDAKAEKASVAKSHLDKIASGKSLDTAEIQSLAGSIDSMTVPQIKEALRSMGEKVSGAKKVLTSRVLDKVKAGVSAKVEPKATAKTTSAEPDVNFVYPDGVKPVPKTTNMTPDQQKQNIDNIKKAYDRAAMMKSYQSGFVPIAAIYDHMNRMGLNPDADDIRYSLQQLENNRNIELRKLNEIGEVPKEDYEKGSIGKRDAVFHFVLWSNDDTSGAVKQSQKTTEEPKPKQQAENPKTVPGFSMSEVNKAIDNVFKRGAGEQVIEVPGTNRIIALKKVGRDTIDVDFRWSGTDDVRQQYSSHQQLQRGSKDVLDAVKNVASAIGEKGKKITYFPLGSQRKDLYKKMMGRLGFEQVGTGPLGKPVWGKTNKTTESVIDIAIEDILALWPER